MFAKFCKENRGDESSPEVVECCSAYCWGLGSWGIWAHRGSTPGPGAEPYGAGSERSATTGEAGQWDLSLPGEGGTARSRCSELPPPQWVHYYRFQGHNVDADGEG